MNPTDIAKVCHEANKAYCESMGDMSQAPWAYTDPGIRASAENGVMLYLDNPKTTPEEAHTNWVEFKRAQGWTVGLVKDEDAKKHPSLIPFDDLPIEEQIKDSLFASICKVFIKAAIKAATESGSEEDDEPPVIFPTKGKE